MQFLMLVAVLGVIAFWAPEPSLSDRNMYESLRQEWIIPGCGDIHCFRVLVPWALGLVPGPALFAWKAFAVLCEAGAAWSMGRWVTRLGAPSGAATQVIWMTALGSGSLYALFDPHTSDPLMHLLAPVLMLLLFQSRILAPALLAAVGIFAKEFAAVPLFVAAGTWAQQRRLADARGALLAGVVATALWGAWQIGLRLAYGYSAGNNHSAELLQGGFIVYWLSNLGPARVVSALAMTLGTLWVLWPAGLLWGRRDLTQLTVAAVPCILALCYVQQPDRALWNFAFIMMPAAAVILARVPSALGWCVVLTHGMLNLRVGAQLMFVPAARFSLVAAGVMSLFAVWQAASAPERGDVSLV